MISIKLGYPEAAVKEKNRNLSDPGGVGRERERERGIEEKKELHVHTQTCSIPD